MWADGSNSMYRQWSSGEPNDAGLGEDCVHTSGQPEWNDQSCTLSWSCYYCITESEFSKIHYKIVIIMVLIKISIYSSMTKLTNYIKTSNRINLGFFCDIMVRIYSSEIFIKDCEHISRLKLIRYNIR